MMWNLQLSNRSFEWKHVIWKKTYSDPSYIFLGFKTLNAPGSIPLAEYMQNWLKATPDHNPANPKRTAQNNSIDLPQISHAALTKTR